ncbi:hypothetical protein T492DRAFT_1057557 [Pavlovales sp. CCMP2436]|nr:hypothetical protein T492DRAFT_1057557 [Pavlovales sp. CCMP2436]
MNYEMNYLLSLFYFFIFIRTALEDLLKMKQVDYLSVNISSTCFYFLFISFSLFLIVTCAGVHLLLHAGIKKKKKN